MEEQIAPRVTSSFFYGQILPKIYANDLDREIRLNQTFIEIDLISKSNRKSFNDY